MFSPDSLRSSGAGSCCARFTGMADALWCVVAKRGGSVGEGVGEGGEDAVGEVDVGAVDCDGIEAAACGGE